MKISLKIPHECNGYRLDQALAACLPEYSRARLQKWVKLGCVTLDDASCRPRDIVVQNQTILIDVTDNLIREQENREIEPQDIPLNVIYEDADLIVLDKPAGLVVHPAAGNPDGTLCNALLFHYPELGLLPRAGIVHRLDRDTTGLMVVARTLPSHASLVRQLQARAMGREYEAVVNGVMVAGGRVDAPIGRHPVNRKRMAVVAGGKDAVTCYRILERFHAHTRVRLKLESGRTHQIRVHMSHIHHPVVGDPVYGGRKKIPAGAATALKKLLREFPRQALHACKLTLMHPINGDQLDWQAPMPADMQDLLQGLKG